MTSINFTLPAALLGLALLSGCNNGEPSGTTGSDTSAATSQNTKIQFRLTVGDSDAKCGETYDSVGTSSASLKLQDARIYVSNVRLLNSAGGETPLSLTSDGVWQNESVALLDFEDASGNCNGNPQLNSVIRGTAPAGSYTGIAFDIGVPEALNHQDPTLAPAPLNVSSLSWPWRAGYKHTTIDIETVAATDETAEASGFSIHLGATGCGEGPMRAPPETSCINQNRPTVRLPGFDPGQDVVVMDLAALLSTTDITVNQPDTASGCMSGPTDSDCFGIFDAAGLNSAPQSFARVGSR